MESGVKKQLKKDDNRLAYFDFVKGLGIILMVMGHIGFSEVFDIGIHSFHMPLFFVVSGYFFKKNDFTERLKKKTKTLLLPYLCFGFFNFIVYLFMRVFSEGWNIHHMTALVRLFSWNHQGLGIADALWFLTALYFCDAFYTFFYGKKHWKIIVIGISLFFAIISNYTTIRLPWSMNTAGVALLFYYVGNDMSESSRLKKMYMNPVVDILALVVAIPLIATNGHVNMRSGMYGNIILFYVDAVLVSLAICGIAYNVYLLVCRYNCGKIGYNLIAKIGSASLTYMSINQLLIKLSNSVIGNSENYCLKVVELIVLLLIMYFIHCIIDRSKLRIILGKGVGRK